MSGDNESDYIFKRSMLFSEPSIKNYTKKNKPKNTSVINITPPPRPPLSEENKYFLDAVNSLLYDVDESVNEFISLVRERLDLIEIKDY